MPYRELLLVQVMMAIPIFFLASEIDSDEYIKVAWGVGLSSFGLLLLNLIRIRREHKKKGFFR